MKDINLNLIIILAKVPCSCLVSILLPSIVTLKLRMLVGCVVGEIDTGYNNAYGYLESSNSVIRCPLGHDLPSITFYHLALNEMAILTWTHFTSSSWLRHWPHREPLWLCLDTVHLCLLHFSITHINLPFCPGPSDPWKCPGVECSSGTIEVSLGRRDPHLSADQDSCPLLSPLAGVWQSAQSPTVFLSLVCEQGHGPMSSGKEMLKGSVSIPGIKGGNQTFIHLFTLEPLYSSEFLATP